MRLALFLLIFFGLTNQSLAADDSFFSASDLERLSKAAQGTGGPLLTRLLLKMLYNGLGPDLSSNYFESDVNKRIPSKFPLASPAPKANDAICFVNDDSTDPPTVKRNQPLYVDLRFFQPIIMRAATYAALGAKAKTIHSPYNASDRSYFIPSSADVGIKILTLLDTIAAYSDWGGISCDANASDLARSHLLVAVAYAYKLLSSQMTETQKSTIEAKLNSEAKATVDFFSDKNQKMYKAYYNNHYWWAAAGVYAASQVLPSSTYTQEISTYRNFGRNLLYYVLDKVVPHEGSDFEGGTYGAYGREALFYILRALPISEKKSLVTSVGWLRNSSRYFAANVLPDGERMTCFGHHEGCRFWQRTAAFDFEIARLTQDEKLQRHAIATYEKRMEQDGMSPKYTGLELFAVNTSSDPGPGDVVGVSSMIFADEGRILASDKNLGPSSTPTALEGRSLVLFKSGFPAGKKTTELVRDLKADDPDFPEDQGAHVQGDANSFSYYLDGEYLIRDLGTVPFPFAGTTTILNHSIFENTITFGSSSDRDQVGQYWNVSDPFKVATLISYLPLPIPAVAEGDRVTLTESADHYFRLMVGDAGTSYPTEVGVQSVRRNLLYTPDYVLLYDVLTYRSGATVTRSPNWNFHMVGDAVYQSSTNSFDITRSASTKAVMAFPGIAPTFNPNFGWSSTLEKIDTADGADCKDRAVPASPTVKETYCYAKPREMTFRQSTQKASYLRLKGPLKKDQFVMILGREGLTYEHSDGTLTLKPKGKRSSVISLSGGAISSYR